MASERGSDLERPPWLAEALWIAAASAVAIWIVAGAWHGALDAITDTGRDLLIPEQLRAGARLYRDVLYYYPPLAPYFLAALTALTGSSLAAYTAIGTAIALLTAGALYAAARVTGGVHAAGAATLLFVSGSVYSVSGRTMNYLIPYAYAATLAMLFFLSAAAFLALFLFVRRRGVWMALAVALLLAASWTKIEYAAFSLLVLLVATLAYRVPFRWMAAYAVAGVLSLVAVSLFFADAPAGQHWLRHNVLAPSLLRGEPARYFYKQVMGFDAAGANLLAAAAGALLTAAMAALVLWAGRARRPFVTVLAGVLLALAAVAGGGVFTRGWALLQVALVPLALRRRDPLLLLITLSLCGSSRVFLRLFPAWYGFVFVLPSYLLIVYVLFEWLPARGLYSRQTALLWSAPLIVICAQLLVAEQRILARKIHPVYTDRGVFYEANGDRAAVLSAFLADLDARRPRSLVVIPEGLTLNYLARVPNPLIFHTFTPVETADPEIERQIIRQMGEREPQLIAVVTRSVSDFGFRAFGIDYNRELAALIRERYTVVKEWRLPGFELILLERAGGGPSEAVLSSAP
ncbi:MAG TPA: hypothetical protein VNA04_08810 [Thermoanaerobaculia bacterium]|nr:hypothetical protein [Thermoanaerobaculia bacterium]